MKNELTSNNEINWKPQDADKEAIKYSIRARVRNAKVSEKAIFLPARPKPSILDIDKKIVGYMQELVQKVQNKFLLLKIKLSIIKKRLEKIQTGKLGKYIVTKENLELQ